LANPDVIVIGGGVVGCACALELAERGAAVLVLERAGLAAAASGRNLGLLLPNPDRRSYPLFCEGVGRYRWLAANSGVPFGLRPTGWLLLAADEAGLAAGHQQAAGLADNQLTVEALDPKQLLALEPSVAGDVVGGFRVEGGYVLDPTAATLALAEAARRAGAQLRPFTAARRLLTQDHRVTGVLTDRGSLPAGAVVDAAGPWSATLAATAGVDLPVTGARGWLLQTAPLPWPVGHVLQEAGWPGPAGVGAQVRPPTFAALAGERPAETVDAVTFTLAQSPTGAAVVGASVAASLREDPEQPESVGVLARRALRFVPRLQQVPVVASWSGVRPVTPDGAPLIGPLAAAPGLWVAAGHGPQGLLLAPSTARMLANHLTSGRGDADADAFDPARPLGAPDPATAGA
jgi:glycine/D-amino acid oxidase-like deaminating enzyme